MWFWVLALFGLVFVGSCLVGGFGFVFSCGLEKEALLYLNILDQCKFRISVPLHSTKQSWQPWKLVLTPPILIPCVSCSSKHAFL